MSSLHFRRFLESLDDRAVGATSRRSFKTFAMRLAFLVVSSPSRGGRPLEAVAVVAPVEEPAVAEASLFTRQVLSSHSTVPSSEEVSLSITAGHTGSSSLD